MKPRIAIIGAGISGLTVARALTGSAEVNVFEKSRGVGGRMSTRYAEPFYFDHGTQFFTARTQAFRDFLEHYMQQGALDEWKGKIISLEAGKKLSKHVWFEPHLVATPNMNSLCKKMAEGIAVLVNTEVAPLIAKQSDGWHLRDKDGNALGTYDWVISTAPPAQTLRLFAAQLPEKTQMNSVRMQGCYTLMIGFNKPWDKQWIAAKVRDNPIEWIAINSTKPHRNRDVTSIVVHTQNQWAEDHIDDDVKIAEEFLLQNFQAVSGIDCSAANHISTHRWKYAIVDQPEKFEPYIDPNQYIAATGDWCGASRIEDVWLSAMHLVQKLRSQ
ncbi:MAG: FAD-dependent oxidoreductase [Rickettsiales bacterium]|nr:FAD-dependent oxidoreductase [Rickettsiales bacterium]